LVPGLEGLGRSESVVLKKTVDYMRVQLAERRKLAAQIEEAGGHVSLFPCSVPESSSEPFPLCGLSAPETAPAPELYSPK